MTRDVIVVPSVLSLAEAWEIMTEKGIRHLPIVESGALVGIVSDRDLLLEAQRREDGELVFPNTFVGEIMSICLVTCTATTTVGEAASLMIEKKIDALPVVTGTMLVGLVTSSDLLDILRDRPPQKVLPFQFNIEERAAAAVA